MATAPFIPETAPFTPDQRAWLNDLLAGLFGDAVAVPQPATAALKIAVLYASQSGTGEGLARKVMKDLKAKGHSVSLISLDAFTPAALAKIVFVTVSATMMSIPRTFAASGRCSLERCTRNVGWPIGKVSTL